MVSSRTDQSPKTSVRTKSFAQDVSPIGSSSLIQGPPHGKESGPSVIPSLPDPHVQGVSLPAHADRTSLQSQPREHHGNNVGHVTQHRLGFNETEYRAELTKQNYEVELKGMMGKIQDVESEKYKVEIEMSNKLAELETKVRYIETKQRFFFKKQY